MEYFIFHRICVPCVVLYFINFSWMENPPVYLNCQGIGCARAYCFYYCFCYFLILFFFHRPIKANKLFSSFLERCKWPIANIGNRSFIGVGVAVASVATKYHNNLFQLYLVKILLNFYFRIVVFFINCKASNSIVLFCIFCVQSFLLACLLFFLFYFISVNVALNGMKTLRVYMSVYNMTKI